MVSSARNPNESYADRAKKAGTTTRTIQHNHQQPTTHVHPPSSLKPPQVNVWAERIKEQQAHVASQPAQMSRQRATSSSQPPRDDAIQPRSPPPDLSAQLAILDQQDDHDPFVVRVPSHLSRRSSSSTNPVTDLNAWPLPGTAPHSNNTSSAGQETPFVSAPPSRQNSTASVRHHAYSSSGSVHLSRVQSFPHHSRSASQSRAHSRSGSSASSPRLQIRGRTLPQDDSVLQDFRLDSQHRRSSNKRSSPALPDPPNHIPSSLQIDPTSHPVDPPYYRHPPVPPLQDMPPRYAQNLIPQYVLPPHFTLPHLPGHASPPYLPHSGQGTPPYPHCPPYPAYMYRHGNPPPFWGDVPQRTFNHFQNQPSVPLNHANTFEHAVSHKIEFGTISPLITTESIASKPPAESQNGSQLRSSKNVVFGTINPAESQDEPNVPPCEQQRANKTIEHVAEQFAAFSIGISPNEPGPSRNASRKPSVKSLSRTPSSQPATNDGATDADISSPSSREINGTRKPIKWEFGTTLSGDIDNLQRPASPSQTSISDLTRNQQSKPNDDESDPHGVPPSNDALLVDRAMDKSETESITSDVWVVKDYGYGFGNHSGYGNAPDVVREMRQRNKDHERGHMREGHREVPRDQHRDRSWIPPRQLGRRHENGVEEGREGLEQPAYSDVPRHMRPRRGSFSGYGGQDRGGFSRRGRGFAGRFHGGRGRVGFFHHQRPGSYSYAPPPQQPPPPPFEVLTPTIDTVNGYGPYAPPELESYEAVPPAPQPRILFTPATYSVDAMRNCLSEQLEYYLSPQNMAQDFYLRQRMDNQGWIPISLLASFKRVQQLHTDADVVKEVLSRSATVEVSGDWVRMGERQWEVFVLPNAPRSAVTADDDAKSTRDDSYGEGVGYSELGETDGDHGEIEGDCDGEDCEGDDEDDDIEFVIGEEAEGSWMPVPERK